MSVINTNIKSMVAQDSLVINNRKLATAMERLSTGSRINSAADDAAGLGISTRMDSQVRGLNMAIRNANDTISVVQTAEGAMQEVNAILQRMRELSVQSASDTNSGIDRSYIQAEVSQLSAEIDRIADTTQWNAVNILDGSYANKLFQIGANANQTIGFSVGSMKSSVLGVASSQPNNGAMPGVPAPGVTGAVAEGVAASPTVIRLEFEESDTYTFTVADDVTGVEAKGPNGVVLDLTSEKSKTDFLDATNKAFKEAAVNTSITGSVATFTDFDLTDSDNYEDVRFSISVAGGTPSKSIDLRSRILSTAGVTSTAVAGADIATAAQTELRALYDDSISVTYTAGTGFKVEDAQGRELEISQGAGSGAIFGTDAANDGPLTIEAQVQSVLSAAWDGNDLVVTNSAGGKTTVAGYLAGAGSKVMFNAVNDEEAGQNYDPIALVAAATSSDTVYAQGRVEDTSLAMRFSDRIGSGTASTYNFNITTGDGDVLATLALDVHEDIKAATIEAAVTTALGTGIGNLSDASIDVEDFEVSFVGDTLTVTNTSGLSMRVESFDSTHGSMTVTPMNELSGSTVLASQGHYYSTGRVAVNTSSLGATADFTLATDTGKFDVYVDGVKSTAGIDLTFDGTDNASLAALATAMEGAITALTDVKIGTTDAVQDMAGITVDAEPETGTLLIRDSLGRRIALVAQGTNDLPTHVLSDGGGSTTPNNSLTVATSSSIARGGLYEATQVKMSLNMDKADFTFSLNGIFLDNATNTTAGEVVWDTTDPFQGSPMETALDALMTKLNGDHPSPVYEYEVSGNEITFYHRGGGTIEIADFAVDAGYEGLRATITPASGQGDSAIIQQHQINASAYATGSAATATSAVLQLSGDDLISLSVSDGENSFVLGSTAVDVDDLNSTTALTNKLNDVLGGSSIKASMDTKGNLYFTDTTGGTISLTGFSSARGLAATWAPEAGQGDSMVVNNGFVGTAPALAPVTGGVGGGAGTAIAQISVATQSGSNQALTVIDAALSYVNAERSKLGAIENRLTHTIDNLTNIVTNTAASRSRIKDTDYAQETTELARTQIIQQAATAMLAQANQAPQSVLALLQ
jgi:flagellin